MDYYPQKHNYMYIGAECGTRHKLVRFIPWIRLAKINHALQCRLNHLKHLTPVGPQVHKTDHQPLFVQSLFLRLTRHILTQRIYNSDRSRELPVFLDADPKSSFRNMFSEFVNNFLVKVFTCTCTSYWWWIWSRNNKYLAVSPGQSSACNIQLRVAWG